MNKVSCIICAVVALVSMQSCSIYLPFTSNVPDGPKRGKVLVVTNNGDKLSGDSALQEYNAVKTLRSNNSMKYGADSLSDVLLVRTRSGEGFIRQNGVLKPVIKGFGINVYEKTTNEMVTTYTNRGTYSDVKTSNRTTKEYLIQKTDSGAVKVIDYSLLREMVKDYEPSKTLMDEYFRENNAMKKYRFLSMLIYLGSAYALTKVIDESGTKSKEGRVATYATVGSLAGGLGFSYYLLKRKKRSLKKIELAIDEYNQWYNRKKL